MPNIPKNSTILPIHQHDLIKIMHESNKDLLRRLKIGEQQLSRQNEILAQQNNAFKILDAKDKQKEQELSRMQEKLNKLNRLTTPTKDKN